MPSSTGLAEAVLRHPFTRARHVLQRPHRCRVIGMHGEVERRVGIGNHRLVCLGIGGYHAAHYQIGGIAEIHLDLVTLGAAAVSAAASASTSASG